MLKKDRPIKPVSLDDKGSFVRLLDPPVELDKHPAADDAWCNYYREDDVCAVAFYYLDRP
jgi:hypothetical protein